MGTDPAPPTDTQRHRVVIMGAAGRDFHNFNTVYRGDPDFEVIAFTATQIPKVAGRSYPPALAGPGYPKGIPIVSEDELETLCRRNGVERVVFAYSDIDHASVMHKASIALTAGSDFVMLGPRRTMIEARLPVIAVSAVRTGCGKSQTARWLSQQLKAHGLRTGVVRHPMPYGDLERQRVQRFTDRADLDAAECTIEEREEYEPHLRAGNIVYAGVDYEEIIALASSESDLILWDGGNNDFPFVRPDLHIVLVDPLRPGDETSHHPGEAVLRMADVVLVAKVNSAEPAGIKQVEDNARRINPRAPIFHGASPVRLESPDAVHGKRVLVVEDGPTLTHGGMSYGAGHVAASEAGAGEIVDPRPFACADVAAVYRDYPHLGAVLPAVGYYPSQLTALAETINSADVDVVVSATPCDLSALIEIEKPVVRARYEFADAGSSDKQSTFWSFVEKFLDECGLRGT